jgi:hypothetical protein
VLSLPVIIDASVALKWVLDEDDSVLARSLATRELAAPIRVERGRSHAVLRVEAGDEVTELLVFTHALSSPAMARQDIEILRVASAAGPAQNRVRMRLPDGTLIAPRKSFMTRASCAMGRSTS